MPKELSSSNGELVNALIKEARLRHVIFGKAPTNDNPAYAVIPCEYVVGKVIRLKGQGNTVKEQFQDLYDRIFPKSMSKELANATYSMNETLATILKD